MTGRRSALWVLVVASMLSGCGVRGEPMPTRLDDLALPPESVPEEAAPEDEGPATVVYFVRGERLEPVERPIPTTLTSALRGLLEGPRVTETEGGLRSAVPAGTALRGVSVESGIATVDVTEGFTAVLGPEQVLAVAQVVYTATGIPDVVGVRLAIAGEPTSAARGDGSLAAGPVGRADYAALMDG